MSDEPYDIRPEAMLDRLTEKIDRLERERDEALGALADERAAHEATSFVVTEGHGPGIRSGAGLAIVSWLIEQHSGERLSMMSTAKLVNHAIQLLEDP